MRKGAAGGHGVAAAYMPLLVHAPSGLGTERQMGRPAMAMAGARRWPPLAMRQQNGPFAWRRPEQGSWPVSYVIVSNNPITDADQCHVSVTYRQIIDSDKRDASVI